MKRTVIVFIGLILAGCVPSWNPLYTEKDLVFNDALIGTWIPNATPGSKETWVFSKEGDKLYALEQTDDEGRKAGFRVGLVRLKDYLFLDLYLVNVQSGEGKLNAWASFSLAPAHLFLKVHQIEPTLKIAAMNPDWMKKFLQKHPESIPHRVVFEDSIVLTGSTKELQKFIVRIQVDAVKSENVCRDTAKLLAEQKVIGWFQDRSEFGPRALGNRSLIADPRKPEMKDILNSRVKHRQAFRPFAPIVLAERMKEIFEGDEDSPFMLIAKPVRPEWRDKIPAIVHVDGTARVQTVREATNPMLYRLLKEFDALTGVPVLINTSFNIKGEPIVETPEDAVNCFLTTGVDHLVIHDTIVSKNAMHKVVAPVLNVYADVRTLVASTAQPA